jgi:cytochrome c551
MRRSVYWRLLYVCSLGAMCFFTACQTNEKKDSEEMSGEMMREDPMRYELYLAQGRKLYAKHCAQCHQADGSGLAQLIPPLAGADFLQDTAAVVCIIRYGAQEPLRVNGRLYQQPMPANPQLRPIEVAEIATFISNSWGNQGSFISVQDAEQILKTCSNRD